MYGHGVGPSLPQGILQVLTGEDHSRAHGKVHRLPSSCLRV
jgi:hypothetical protein